jgi:RNA polymerase sigma factor (sigma-70 family)
MSEPDDHQLLAEFARENSEAAFAALVQRHINLVYSAALRRVGNPHAAEEITQAVFIILARKAGKLSPRIALSGWLYQTARLTAANFLRGEIRRQKREQEAYMQSTLNEPVPDVWPQIAPLLDDALGRLGERDRNAIVLRFFENKSLGEVGAALGASEDAAKMRVNRALEKLRKIFTKRGVTLSATLIAGAVSTSSVQAAPAGLTATISTVAITKGAAAGGSTLALVKGALKIMAWAKVKMAIAVGVGVLLAVETTTVTIHQIRKAKYDPNDFQATTYSTGSPEMMQFMTNSYGHLLNYTFPITEVQRCSINGLLNQCMEISGWRYLMDKEVAAGSVKFGCPKVYNGEEWVAAFESALQTNTPEWWVVKKKGFRHENLVLIRFPKEKTVLVVPKEKAAQYQ